MKKLFLASALIMAPTAVLAADLPFIEEAPASFDTRWEGFYGGIQGGYSAMTTHEAGFPDQDIDGATFGVFGGYNAVFNNMLVGLELDANIYNDETYISTRTSTQTLWSAGLSARVGYTMGALLPYLKAGIGFLEGESTFHPTGAKEAEIHTIFDIGGGVEAMIMDNVSVRAEGLYRFGSEEDYTINGATGGVDFDGFVGRVGIAYHF